MAKEIIDKKNLEHLAKLARIELNVKKEGKMINDLEKILEYFKEIKDLNTGIISLALSGAITTNAVREDEILDKNLCNKQDKLKESFPEKEGEYLKVPGVFE